MITVFGSINLDLVVTAERLPQPGETIGGRDFTNSAGGKGANQAVAALRAGADMKLCGAVGDDAFAQGALAELEKDHADLSQVARLDGATGIAMILVDDKGENVIVVVPGANGQIDAEMASDAVSRMSEGDHLVLQQEIPAAAIKEALTDARAKGVKTVLNIAPIIDETEELAALADYVIANETEFARLSGRAVAGDALEEALTARAERTGQTFIVTLGAEGVIAASPGHDLMRAASPKITPVDTVGAGDTFCGYFSAGLDAGLGLEDALQRAAIAGALACLNPGAQTAIPYADAVDEALRNFSR